MTTESTPRTERQKLETKIRVLEDRVHDLRGTIEDAESELDDIKQDLHVLRRAWPPLPKVMEVEHDGWKWFTDGWRAFRGSWPSEYEPNEGAPDVGGLLVSWAKVEAPVKVLATAQQYDLRLAYLTDGTFVRADWLSQATAMGYSLHHETSDVFLYPGQPVVFRDAVGAVVGCQMPISAKAADLADWRDPSGVAYDGPPALPTPSGEPGAPNV